MSSQHEIALPVGQALDVGCGTGQSTRALKVIAAAVVGTDLSAAMLAQVQPEPQIRYLEAPAEEVPLPAAWCDLITSSLAIHWFERERFLAEAQRLLKPQGWLVIYNNGFLGQMLAQPVFEPWHNEVYLLRYPSPPRQVAPLTAEQAHRFGLLFAHREQYQNEVDFTVETLAAYLTTQSNVIAAVEQGSESVEAIYQWLVAELSPCFLWNRPRLRLGATSGIFRRNRRVEQANSGARPANNPLLRNGDLYLWHNDDDARRSCRVDRSLSGEVPQERCDLPLEQR